MVGCLTLGRFSPAISLPRKLSTCQRAIRLSRRREEEKMISPKNSILYVEGSKKSRWPPFSGREKGSSIFFHGFAFDTFSYVYVLYSMIVIKTVECVLYSTYLIHTTRPINRLGNNINKRASSNNVLFQFSNLTLAMRSYCINLYVCTCTYLPIPICRNVHMHRQ